jgi:Peptidase family M41
MSEQPGERRRDGQRRGSQPSPQPPDRASVAHGGAAPAGRRSPAGTGRPRWLPLVLTDAEVRRISTECYEEARRLLRENRDRRDAIVALLLERETLDEAEVYAVAGIPRNTVAPVRV